MPVHFLLPCHFFFLPPLQTWISPSCLDCCSGTLLYVCHLPLSAMPPTMLLDAAAWSVALYACCTGFLLPYGAFIISFFHGLLPHHAWTLPARRLLPPRLLDPAPVLSFVVAAASGCAIGFAGHRSALHAPLCYLVLCHDISNCMLPPALSVTLRHIRSTVNMVRASSAAILTWFRLWLNTEHHSMARRDGFQLAATPGSCLPFFAFTCHSHGSALPPATLSNIRQPVAFLVCCWFMARSVVTLLTVYSGGCLASGSPGIQRAPRLLPAGSYPPSRAAALPLHASLSWQHSLPCLFMVVHALLPSPYPLLQLCAILFAPFSTSFLHIILSDCSIPCSICNCLVHVAVSVYYLVFTRPVPISSCLHLSFPPSVTMVVPAASPSSHNILSGLYSATYGSPPPHPTYSH